LKRGNVKYHGALRGAEQIQAILDQCQVLVTPSHSEGMPNVIMEGMARGLAIVATPVGSVESIVNEDNGWLVEPGKPDVLADLLTSISRLDKDTILTKQVNSLQRIKLLTWDIIAREVAAKISERLLNK
jgi:glycosyltransferase involved in cell wall biosynthesis